MPTDPWEQYFRAGWLVSSPLGSRSGYSGEVLGLWQRFFAEVPPGSRIVDIGTGNGAIALIARDVAVARRATFDIHGVDRAAIDPAQHVADGERLFEGIRFHGGISAESLPFDGASVQAVSGQHVLEYTDVQATLRELTRIMEPGGRALFVIHRMDSPLTVHARESVALGDLIFRETRVFEHLRRFVEIEKLEPRRAPALHRRLAAIGNELRTVANTTPHPQLLQGVLTALARIFAARGRASTSDQLKSIRETEISARTMIRLLEQLASVAMGREQLESIVALAEGSFHTTLECEDVPGAAGDWRLSLQRRVDCRRSLS